MARFWSVPLLALASLFGCASDPATEPADEIEAVPFPSTKMLSAADLVDLSSAPDGTLTFERAPALLSDVHVGTVMVAGVSGATPVGLLRVVTEVVERSGDRLVLRTAAAPIQVAFRKLHARVRRDVADITVGELSTNVITAGLTRRGLGADVIATIPLDFPVYDADGDPGTKTDQVAVQGSVGGGFRFDLTIDVDWGAIFDLPENVADCLASVAGIFVGEIPTCRVEDLLPEIKVAFQVDPVLQASLALVGSASLSYEKDIDIATIVIAPIVLGPLVFVPSVDIVARIEGSASAGFIIGAHGSAEFRTSFSVSTRNGPDVVPFELVSTDLSADDTQVTLSAKAKIGAGARLNLQLYGVVGPNASARAYVQVSGEIGGTPCWDLRLGLEGDIGARITSPTLPVLGSVTLFEWTSPPFVAFDEKIAEGTCLPIPRGPQLPPGQGPDADALANPSFAPWVASVEDTGNDGRALTPTGEGGEWLELTLAIDGRYVVSGSRTDRLLKIDDDGRAIWARRYRREPTTPALALLRVAPTADAAMMVLTRAAEGEPSSLLEVGQAGHPLFRRTIVITEAECPIFEPITLVRDGGRGFFVAGTCAGGDSLAVIHLDAAASVLDVRRLRDADGTRSIAPNVAVVVDGELVILGRAESVTEGTTMFAARLDAAGAVRFAKRYQNCESPQTIAPLAARALADGQILFAGSSGNNRTGMLGRLRADGEVAFAGFATINQSDYFFLTSFAELPTTGFVATAATLEVDPGKPGFAAVGLDGGGRPLWAKAYERRDGRAITSGAMRLTNDGGAVLVALTARPNGSEAGGVTALKVYAKDGTAGDVSTSDLALRDLPCVMSAEPWSIAVDESRARTSAALTVFE